ncbi:zinc-binding oxidoreductase CipB [Podospora appendiculata]|uniref:Zinc-binding oxidoreductase CipB n=1 Tax=Podospora appendiculata TaxID=314037 RepID=A0AAE0XCY4_9PEZI|nr:zinc-binding oxidoreductase CipB [Podospora appendiculata]
MAIIRNRAAYIVAKATPFQVREAPYPSPLPHEIVIKARAVAVNPVDWKLQYQAIFDLKYPHILGEDVAGDVVEVGSAVDTIKVGDRVTAYAEGIPTRDPRNGAFQLYVAVSALMAAKIPASLSFTAATVIPLGAATAAAGLFQEAYLHLPLPVPAQTDQEPVTSTASTDYVLLVWGGSSSVGSNAIQLAVASGARVATTASARNFDYAKGLGAEWVFDYNSPAVVDEIIAAVKKAGVRVAGVFDAIGGNAVVEACVDIVNIVGAHEATIATVDPGRNSVLDGVPVRGVAASDIGKNEVGRAIFHGFLPRALETGQFLPKPDAWVVAEGLEGVQKGVDASRRGVSARKVIVTL